MKDDKTKPASERQRKQAKRLGVVLSDRETVRSACGKINAAALAEAIKAKRGNQWRKSAVVQVRNEQ